MCDDRERLLGYLYNEGDDTERRDVEQHLEGCETCREELSGLRATRQDLLAWDVPEHGSVWKPFVPVKMAPRWRDIPAWALAAAASLMFVVGAAGGVVTHAMFEKNGAPADQIAAKTPTDAQPVVARVAPAELSAMEQRMLRDMRAELAAIQQQSARTLPPMMTAGLVRPADVDNRITASEQRQFESRLSLNNSIAQLAKSTDARIQALSRQIDWLIQMQQQQGGK